MDLVNGKTDGMSDKKKKEQSLVGQTLKENPSVPSG
jgi:hypothetical protein